MKFLPKVMAGLLVLTGLAYCSKETGFWDALIPETDEEPTASQVNGYIFRPAVVPATDERVQQLRVPEGFRVEKFAEDLGKPRILLVGNNGHVYYSDRDAGVVVLLKDENADGVAEQKLTVANIPQAHGLAMHNGRMYIMAIRELYSATINADGTLGAPEQLLANMPDGGQHPNRTIDFGPDGKLYISIGSTCNSCTEPNPLHATMVTANADGTGMEIFARGLRNTIGFDWHPETGELWGMDHGIDWLGDDVHMEEVNRITQGANYGWPYIYANGEYNPGDRPPGDTTYQQYQQLSTPPVNGYQAHAAPMQMVFYNADQFPADYRGDAFIAMRGSWNRSTPVGYRVVRLHFEDGQPTRFEDFLTGFLVDNNRAHFGRLVGIAVHSDGSLLVGDDTNGVIYRISNQ